MYSHTIPNLCCGNTRPMTVCIGWASKTSVPLRFPWISSRFYKPSFVFWLISILRVLCSNLEGGQQPRCCIVEPWKAQRGTFVSISGRAMLILLTFDRCVAYWPPRLILHRVSRSLRELYTRAHSKSSRRNLSCSTSVSCPLTPLVSRLSLYFRTYWLAWRAALPPVVCLIFLPLFVSVTLFRATERYHKLTIIPLSNLSLPPSLDICASVCRIATRVDQFTPRLLRRLGTVWTPLHDVQRHCTNSVRRTEWSSRKASWFRWPS